MACLRSVADKKEDQHDRKSTSPSEQGKNILQIYTDWANHYLERGRFKRHIQDLQTDVSDGVLLADVIEAVTGTRVPEITRKPKTSSQMVENLKICLTFLENLGVNVEGVTAKEIRDGNLKSILGLFFNLSRYKQAQKLAVSATNQNSNTGSAQGKPSVPPSTGGDMLSKLPTPFKGNNSRNTTQPSSKDTLSSIPAPSLGSSGRRSGQSERNTKNGISSGTNNAVGSLVLKAPSADSSRSGSPHGSFIPQPRGGVVTRERSSTDRSQSRPSSTSSTSSIPHFPVKSSSGVTLRNSPGTAISLGNKNSPYNNNSMLDKFKLFNSKEKSSDKVKGGAFSKRTSSSSGFSSARSERSDSSNSICSEPKSGSTPEGPEASTSPTSPGVNSPKIVVKNFAKKTFGRSSTSSSKSNNIKTANPSKDIESTKPNSVKPTCSKLPGCATVLKENSENKESFQNEKYERTHKEKSDRKDSCAPKVKSDLSKQTDRTQYKESATYKENNLSLDRKPCSQKGKTERTGLGAAKARTELGLEKNRSEQIPRDRLEDSEGDAEKGSAQSTNCHFHKDSPQHRDLNLLKDNPKYNDKNNGVVGVETSITNTSAIKSTSKTVTKTTTESHQSKDFEENQIIEGKEIPDRQSKISSLVPKTERALKTLSSEIPSNIAKEKSYNLVGTYSDSSDSMLGQMDNSGNLKPTAAVKGTSKPRKEDFQKDKNTNTSLNCKEGCKKSMGLGSSSDTAVASLCDKQNDEQVKNLQKKEVDMGTCQDAESRSSTKLDHSGSDRCLDGSQNGVSVAKVSPIMSNDVTVCSKSKSKERGTGSCESENKKNKNSFETERNMENKGYQSPPSEGTTQAKTTADVPDAEGVRDLTHRKGNQPAFKKSKKHDLRATAPFPKDMTIIEESDDVMINIKPMQPLTRVSPYGYIRGLGPLSSSRNMTNRLHMPSFRLPSDTGSISSGKIGLSRHILTTDDSSKIYGVPIKRSLGSSSHAFMDMDYVSDMDCMDIAAGYMSDGDVLRPNPVYRAEDIYSGYMSEGGGFLYSRRVSSKANGKDVSSKPINVLQDDSLDDSSSISSGLSDAIADISTDDNLTGSSLSSETNQYGSLKRTTRDGANKYSLSTENKNRRVWDEYVHGVSAPAKSSSGRSANIEKTDSSMQTESSAFHQMSSAVWKKYLQQQHTRAGKTESEARYKDNRNCSASANEKKSSTVNGSGNKHAPVEGQKSKHKTLGQKTEDGRYQDFDLRIEKSLRNGRSTSPKFSKMNSDSVNQLGQSARDLRKGQGSRALVVGSSTSYEVGKRPSSTSSVSSNGSNKTGSSKTHSNPRKEKSEETRNNDIYHLESLDINHVQSSSLPRNVSTASSSSKSIYDRKEKIKVSANTQTNTHEMHVFGSSALSDSEYSSLGRKSSKQYSLMSPTVGGLRERVYGTRSVVNGTSNSDYVILSGFPPRERSIHPRLSASSRPNDGDMGNYADIEHPGITSSLPSSSSSTYAWLRYSGSSGASVISGTGTRSCSGDGLTEAESIESLSSTSSSAHAQQIQHARANSLTHARLMIHQKELSGSSRLSRSNSIRSTKSEKLYPSMLQRSDEVDNGYSGSASLAGHPISSGQPSSPNNQGTSRYLFPVSPINPLPQTSNASTVPSNVRFSGSMSHYMGGMLSKISSKEDELHGSSLSVVSSTSSVYSTAEDKQTQEIKKLKRELELANEKIATLTSQLTTNAHMVAAFEQSLSNMTNRLHHLTASAEQKDSELGELRSTIEALSKQSAEAGLTKIALQSMQAVQRSMNGANLVRRHTFNNTKEHALQEHKMSRQMSTDSVSSVNSLSSGNSGNSRSGEMSDGKDKKKKKGWLRSSFSKAFSRSKKNKNGSVSDVEDIRQFQSDSSTPNSPLLGLHHINGVILGNTVKSSHSSSELYEKDDERSSETVNKLKKQLREKEMIITDIRLEALTSAQQLESLKETVSKMQNEMVNLKQDNSRLQKLVSTDSLTSSQTSLLLRNSAESLEKRLSASECSGPSGLDVYLTDAANEQEGKHVTVSIFLGCHGDYNKFRTQNENISEVLIGALSVSGKTKWDIMDNVLKRIFKEYVQRIDPVSNLGLNTESVLSYHIGEIVRAKDAELPELLPCGYLVGDDMQIRITLKGTSQSSVEGLTFETLIPKSIIQRYVSLLMEHRRIILCGPSGTGKTYLAQKLAEYLVLRNGKEVSPGAIATFGVDHKSAKELRQYLTNVAEQCESSNPSDLPTVIILDNLHHVGSLGEVFNGFLSAKYQKCPYIIGTMNQATCSTTNLQLHHNFRWVLCANHMEPVKGFLGRYLRRKLVEHEIQSGSQNPELTTIIDWMPKVWAHLNKFLETHSSSDVTIGPRLFLSCPINVASSQVWFTDLWNYSIVPYLLEAVREGLQLYGRRAPWDDPADWVYESYPWPTSGEGEWPQLLRLRPEDVGYESHPSPGATTKGSQGAQSDVEADPLLNMLMRLQEAASCSSPHGNDGDTTISDHDQTFTSTDLMTGDTVESTL
ncbi:neuron navigator 3-like isoform X3 [Tachypleus tridentatus]|uniref:neuron navigator 3-like isoform X3 n=1 Tax=Tachypleus tridentatus TaxID=6853 RepID=UPI003FCFF8F4